MDSKSQFRDASTTANSVGAFISAGEWRLR
jgi:hypothetical protein